MLTSAAQVFGKQRFESISQEICTSAFTLAGIVGKKTRIPEDGTFVKIPVKIIPSEWRGFGSAFGVGAGQTPGKHHTAGKT